MAAQEVYSTEWVIYPYGQDRHLHAIPCNDIFSHKADIGCECDPAIVGPVAVHGYFEGNTWDGKL
jgi:hypothetical protein